MGYPMDVTHVGIQTNVHNWGARRHAHCLTGGVCNILFRGGAAIELVAVALSYYSSMDGRLIWWS